MSRGVGEIEFLQQVLPDWFVAPTAVLTQLGDVWFLSLLLVSLYWTRPAKREALAATGGTTLAGLAVIDTTKHLFALPRPDQSLLPAETLPWAVQRLYELTTFAPGYGFPSGHALMTTVVYLSLVDVLGVGSRRRRFLGAWVLIAVVGVSRIALGMHFLADILAGIGFGLVVLAGMRAALDRYHDRASVAIGLGVILAATNLVFSRADADAVLLFGAALGAFAGWQFFVVIGARRPKADSWGVHESHRLRFVGGALALVLSVVVPVVLGEGRFPAPLAQGELLGLGVAVAVDLPLVGIRR